MLNFTLLPTTMPFDDCSNDEGNVTLTSGLQRPSRDANALRKVKGPNAERSSLRSRSCALTVKLRWSLRSSCLRVTISIHPRRSVTEFRLRAGPSN